MVETLVEIAKWRVNDIQSTAEVLIGYFVRYLPQLGTRRWVRLTMEELIPRLRESKGPGPVKFPAFGFEMTYYPHFFVFDLGARYQNLSVLVESDPSFVLHDQTTNLLLPRERTDFYDCLDGIAEEMECTYKLDVTDDPLRLGFPRNFYADRVERSRVMALG